MEIEEGKVYRNKITKEFIHVKEIARHYNLNKSIANIVCSGDSLFRSDSKTTVRRQILKEAEFLEKYQEEYITLSDNILSLSELRNKKELTNNNHYLHVSRVKRFIEDLKKGMNLTWENAEVIDRLAGEKLR